MFFNVTTRCETGGNFYICSNVQILKGFSKKAQPFSAGRPPRAGFFIVYLYKKEFAMKALKFIVLLLTAFLFVGSCSAQRVVNYQFKTVKDVNLVIDSIMDSGTAVSSFTKVPMTREDGVSVMYELATLYRDGEAKGSIQVFKMDSVYQIKIIDAFTKKELEKKGGSK